MQKLISFGLLVALVGGGWSLFNGSTPKDLKGVIDSAQRGLGGVVEGQQQQAPGLEPAPPGQLPFAGGQTLPPKPPGVIRIATFNIQVFGDRKASKAYVMRTLAAIVQQFDVVAIQEIRTQDNYFIDKFVRGYVNAGGRQYHHVVGPRLGRSSSTEQYAYLFDTATIEINPRSVYTVNDTRDDLLHREPLVAQFRARQGGASPFMFMLINTHTDPDETKDTPGALGELSVLAQVYDVVRRYSPGEDDVILLGDLNTNVPVTRRAMTRDDLFRLGQVPGVYPVVHSEATNSRRTKLHDNILINSQTTTEFTGNGGVLDVERMFGLTREQVVKELSDHLPVWAEFRVTESAQPGRFAAGAGAPRR